MTNAGSFCVRSGYSQRGFSLIDLAVIMAIVGVLLAGFLTTYKMYQATRSTSVTEENFIAAQDALGAFVALNKRYPRPAPFGRFDNEAGYGGATGYGEEIGASGAVSCTATNAAGKVCEASGHGGDVLIGVLPTAALNISDVQARDGMGRLFTYAVSKALTEPESAPGVPTKLQDPDIFSVCVNANELKDDGTFEEISCGEEVNPARPIALISHGKDGVGAWLPSGVQYRACGAVSDAKQNENCNNDGTFSISLRRTGADDAGIKKWAPRLPMLVEGDNENKNDDSLKLEIREDSNFWVKDEGSDRMDNKHNYKVGIGTSDPQAVLDVNGGLKADKLLAKDLCNTDSGGATTCLKVDAIAGDIPDMECPGNIGLVVDIRNNKVHCEYLAKTASCTSGQYVIRIDEYGAPVCADLPATCGPAATNNLTAAPSGAALCNGGSASTVNETSPNAWKWTCTSGAVGSPEHVTVTCYGFK